MTTMTTAPSPNAASSPMATAELPWGRHYAMVRPDHFRVDYVINPFMDVDTQPDRERARQQWDTLAQTLLGLGARVDVLPQRADAPDMVFAMNLGLGVVRHDGTPHAVMSHMRFPERRMETGSAQPFLAERGWTTSYVGRDGVGAHFEAGDAFAFGADLVVGYGPRTEELALKHLAGDLDVRVRGFRIVHPGMYHMDLAFNPLDERRAMVCPSAFDAGSAAALLDLVPDPLVLSEEEALTFCANSVVVGRTVVMPACPPRVRERLEAWGYDIVILDLSEFHKGGGSIRCLTNPLDITLGRDLAHVPGGEVLLP
ncbi:dimethylarginine dimethylaminohydrolase family protein [Nocardioides sp.]|uniref:dimethylarginine dimethylaminohydrolase family protein n=1 Tax=Nocardioides sp. TaxID=35761 RepID=UPI0027370386|nr:arginine deiminase-related protein [Nocardioides sp.]MDP3894436.1 arginine deiminase-related protein [Nocardioides sp.]